MLQAADNPVTLAFRHTLTVATGFWAACLLLTTLEAALGANLVLGGLYFISIPMLVGGLTWANGGCVGRARGPVAVCMLGAIVLLSSSLIILLGLVAASSLMRLMQTGAAAV